MINFDLVIQKEDVFALEISRSKVRVMKLDGKSDKMKTHAFAEVKIPKSSVVGGVIRRDKIVAKAIETALANARPKKIKTPYVITALPDEKIFVKVEEFPYLEKEELRQALELKVASLVAMPLNQVYWDWHRIYSSKKENKVLVLIAAVEKECADSFEDTLKLAGLIPLDFEIPASAAGRAIVEKDKRNDPHLFLNVTESTTVISIWNKGGVYFNSSIRIGRDQVYKVIYDYYEPRKNKEKIDDIIDNLNINDLEPALEKRVDNLFRTLFEEIRNVINYHEERLNTSIDTIELYGTGSNIRNLDKLLSRKLDKTVKLANPNLHITPKPQFISHKKIHPHIVLLGLALRGVKGYKEVSDINLLPDTIQESYLKGSIKDSVFNNLFRFALNNIFIASAIILFIFVATAHQSVLQSAKRETDNTLSSKSYIETQKDIKDLQTEIKNYDTILENHLYFDRVLNELASSTPDSIGINNLNISQTSRLTFEKSKPKPATNEDGLPTQTNTKTKYYVYIQGYSPSRETLLEFTNNLKESDLFFDVRSPLSNYQEDPDSQNRRYQKVDQVQFTIEAEIDTDKLLSLNYTKEDTNKNKDETEPAKE